MNGSVNLMKLENNMGVERLEGGQQRNWEEVRINIAQPIITIITSTYNVAQDIHRTIDSIRNQSYQNLQWIVVDGKSTDGTIEILKEHDDIIDYWFSEPDTGIYDAWNKALEYIEGDWVQFIGAGDELYEKHTLEKVAHYLKDAYPEYELVYGQVMHISEKGRKLLFITGEHWEHYVGEWEGNRPSLPPHPAIFHHKTLFIEQQFDTQFKIVADSHFLLQHLGKSFLYVPSVINIMPLGGISATISGINASYEELNDSLKKLGINLPLLKKVQCYIRYQISKQGVKVLSEKRYIKLLNFVKGLRGKPKIFTEN